MAAADTEVFSGGEPARLCRLSARSAASVGDGRAIAASWKFVGGGDVGAKASGALMCGAVRSWVWNVDVVTRCQG